MFSEELHSNFINNICFTIKHHQATFEIKQTPYIRGVSIKYDTVFLPLRQNSENLGRDLECV